jgi:hypothetical protein
MKFRRKSAVDIKYQAEECVAQDGDSGSVFVLNPTAGWLLSIADDFISVEMAGQLAFESFSVPSQKELSTDISEGVRMLETEGLIEFQAAEEGR